MFGIIWQPDMTSEKDTLRYFDLILRYQYFWFRYPIPRSNQFSTYMSIKQSKRNKSQAISYEYNERRSPNDSITFGGGSNREIRALSVEW